MDKLVLEASKVKILEWNETEYKLRKPSMLEAVHYHRESEAVDKKDVDKALNLSIKFLDKLGLPEKVAWQMEPPHITAILKFLNEAETQGK